jgi:CheY-like chemotaxis protein
VVLFADDEDAIRWIGRRYLEADGWTVVEACDGLEALQKIGSLTGRLDLVITDLNMPRVTGRELAEVLSVFRPGLPVLLSGRGESRSAAPDPAQAILCGQLASRRPARLRGVGPVAPAPKGKSPASAAAAGAAHCPDG